MVSIPQLEECTVQVSHRSSYSTIQVSRRRVRVGPLTQVINRVSPVVAEACLPGEDLLQRPDVGLQHHLGIDLEDVHEATILCISEVIPTQNAQLRLTKLVKVDCISREASKAQAGSFFPLPIRHHRCRIALRSSLSHQKPIRGEVVRLTTPRARDRVLSGRSEALDQSDCRGRALSKFIPLLDGPASSSRGSQASSIGPGWCCSVSGDMPALSVGLPCEHGRCSSEGQSHGGFGVWICTIPTSILPLLIRTCVAC